MLRLVVGWLVLSAAAAHAEWRPAQAAVAVLGQASFSAHAGSFDPVGLAISRDVLHVATRNGQVITYALPPADTSGDSAQCAVCVEHAASTAPQAVPADNARAAALGLTAAWADPVRHRVYVWLNSRNRIPDAVLSVGEPISVALDRTYLYVGDAETHDVLVYRLFDLPGKRSPELEIGSNFTKVGADSISQPAALAADGDQLFVADPVLHRVLVFRQASLPLRSEDVLNSATLQPGPLAPGTAITIKLGTPATGASVLLDGHPLDNVSLVGSEIHAQLPLLLDDESAGSLFVQAESAATVAVPVTIASASPGIFAFGGHTEPRAGLMLHDGHPATSEDPVHPGDELTVWATGLGAVSEDTPPSVIAPLTAEINGTRAELLSAVLPEGSGGIYELHLRVPNLAASASARVLLRIQSGSQISNAVTIPLAATIQ